MPHRPHGDNPEIDTPEVRTRAGRTAPIWLGDDPLVHLREWGTETTYKLPGPDVADAVIGVDPSVEIPIVDPGGSVSRRHARLRRKDHLWRIKDLGSRNGTQIDGGHTVRLWTLIVPGMELGLGDLTLVAENDTLIGLRHYLARVLGWDRASATAIDLAMRAIRASAYHRAPLTIAGVDDLVAVARQIHVRTTAAGAPFVVCGKKTREADASIRVTATIANASAALARAAGGTVCVRTNNRPAHYEDLVDAASDPQATAQLFICARKTKGRSDPSAPPPIVVPKLARRSADDIRRIVREYGLDAVRELGSDPAAFSDSELQWVVRHEAGSFADIEIATLRIVARNETPSLHQAATRVGLSHSGFRKWFKIRRRIPKRPT